MKKTNNILRYLAASLVLLLAACSAESELETSTASGATKIESKGNTGTVCFNFSGAVGEATTRAYQTDEERLVTKLWAVVFTKPQVETKDASSTESSETTENYDTWVYSTYKDIVPANDILYDNKDYYLDLEQGDYYICFVANPEDDLQTAIPTSKTVSGFKELTVKKDPDTKPMTMVSDFKKATVEENKTCDLGTVDLARIMARIDIINKAKGITVTKATFHNRAVQSRLIYKDNSTTGTLETTQKAYTLNLVGDAETENPGNSCTSTIYSYEQYNTTESSSRPYLTINYKLGSTEYTHDVYFKKTTTDNSNTDTYLPLERNYIYRVRLSSDNATITITVTVADWNEGTEFTVSNNKLLSSLTSGYDYSKAQLGDIMLADGTLVSHSAYSSTFPYMSSNEYDSTNPPIGIVAYLYTESDKTFDTTTQKRRVSQNLADALGREPTGLVLALKDASDGEYWKGEQTQTLANNYVYKVIGESYANVKDGLDPTNIIIAMDETQTVETKKHPAFAKVKDFRNTEKSNSNTTIQAKVNSRLSDKCTTEWYLPCIGEWIDICGSSGLGQASYVDAAKNITTTDNAQYDSHGNEIISRFNNALKVVTSDSSQKSTFSSSEAHLATYWSSSENDTECAWNMTFYGSNGGVRFNRGYKHNTSLGYNWRIRCILAF